MFGRWYASETIEKFGGVDHYVMTYDSTLRLADGVGLPWAPNGEIRCVIKPSAFYYGMAALPTTAPTFSPFAAIAWPGPWTDPQSISVTAGWSFKTLAELASLPLPSDSVAMDFHPLTDFATFGPIVQSKQLTAPTAPTEMTNAFPNFPALPIDDDAGRWLFTAKLNSVSATGGSVLISDMQVLVLNTDTGLPDTPELVDNLLTNLTTTSGELLPVFNSGVQSYNLVVPYNATVATFTPTVEVGATVTVNGQAVTSGTLSQEITVPAVVTIVVSGTNRTYIVTVTQSPPPPPNAPTRPSETTSVAFANGAVMAAAALALFAAFIIIIMLTRRSSH